jgi:mRNA interferase MazF
MKACKMPFDPSIPDVGDIFWVNLPYQGGSEQAERRPCIVMSRRSVNTGNTVVVVPMSTKIEKAAAWRILVPENQIIKDLACGSEVKTSVALCHQVRAADRRKFDGKIGKLTQNAVLAVQLGLTFLFDLP